MAPQSEGAKGPTVGNIVDHGHQGVEIIGRPPGHAHAQLDQSIGFKHPVGNQLLGIPKMTGVKGFNLRLHPQFGHHPAHCGQRAGRVGHDIIGLSKIHRAAIECANLRAAFSHMRHPFGRAGHIGARNRWQRGFNVAKNHVTAHSGRQIEHHINLSIPDPVSDFAKHSRISARRAGFRIAHMAMHHRRPRFGG